MTDREYEALSNAEALRPSITSIPALVAIYKTVAQCCRYTGLCEATIARYRFDTKCERHIIINNRLMTHTSTSPVLFTRRGVTRSDRAKNEY